MSSMGGVWIFSGIAQYSSKSKENIWVETFKTKTIVEKII